MQASHDATYREYRQEAFTDLSRCPAGLLKLLSDRLNRSIYEPSAARKVQLPKRSPAARTYTLPCIEDEIVYQALVNVIADRLHPATKSNYFVSVFANLYAGKSSRTFYRDWRVCRRKYIRRARQSVEQGLQYTATFDLTACYDTLDHQVIDHELKTLGFERDFREMIVRLLAKWAQCDVAIPRGCGIPQGPLGSGLLSELVLRHFELRFSPYVPYLRWIDDIRLFWSSPERLHECLEKLDLIGKEVGLHTQASKTEVHIVQDIEAELGSISTPNDDWRSSRPVNQRRLRRRILSLSPRLRVENDTLFKFAVAHAEPSAHLNARLIRILEGRPDLFGTIVRYFRRYERIPRTAAKLLAGMIRRTSLRSSVRASILATVIGRSDLESRGALDAYLKTERRAILTITTPPTELHVEISRLLVEGGYLTARQTRRLLLKYPQWWVRAEVLRGLSDEVYPRRALSQLLNEAITTANSEVAVAAALRLASLDLPVAAPHAVNHSAAVFLRRKLRMQVTQPCGIDHALRTVVGAAVPKLRWARFFGRDYVWAEEQAIEVARCAESNPTAFVNALDVLLDCLLEHLFAKHPTLGKYQSGNVGGILHGGRFAALYPRTYALVEMVHRQRANSRYSHARNRQTRKRTGNIQRRPLIDMKKLLRSATRELAYTI